MTLTFLTTDTLGKHVCRFGCTPVVLPGYFVWNLVVLWGVLTNLYLGLLRASAGGSTSFTASYTAPHAVTEVGGPQRVPHRLSAQPSLRAGPFIIQIQLPPGAQVQASSPGVIVDGDAVRYAGTSETPETFWVRYSR